MENPYNYSQYINSIKEGQSNSSTFVQLNQYFVLSKDLWLQWIEEQEENSKSDLYQRACRECNLWKEYAFYLLSNHSNSSKVRNELLHVATEAQFDLENVDDGLKLGS